MSMGCVNINCRRITPKEWHELSEDEQYGLFGLYSDSNIFVMPKWVGRVADIEHNPQEYWKPFSIVYSTVVEVEDGVYKLTQDKNMSSDYASVSEMMKAYRELLKKITKLTEDEIIDTEYDSVVGWVVSETLPKNKVVKDRQELEEAIELAELDQASGYENSGAW